MEGGEAAWKDELVFRLIRNWIKILKRPVRYGQYEKAEYGSRMQLPNRRNSPRNAGDKKIWSRVG